MYVIQADNIDRALESGVRVMLQGGVARDSRNGPVLEMPTPVTTVYNHPERKILFRPSRDCNVFFHLFETIWFLGGRDDLESLLMFNTGMARYSDDGRFVRGSAYGARWRKWFHHDQLENAVEALRADPNTRRVVLSQWDPYTDPVVSSKDVPCNTQCYLYRRADGALDMTVVNRSNDIIYGCYGSNVVHFSMALEYIANAVGCPMGRYYQVSNSYHAYTENEVWQRVSKEIADGSSGPDYYESNRVRSVPLFATPEGKTDFDADNKLFLDWVAYHSKETPSLLSHQWLDSGEFSSEFFLTVVHPMMTAWFEWKSSKRAGPARERLEWLAKEQGSSDVDWIVAGSEWLSRRKSQ